MYSAMKSIMLILAVLGYACLYQRKSKLSLCFFPITGVSGMTVLVYIFGIAGFLKAGCYVVAGCGVLLLLRYGSRASLKAVLTDAGMLFTVGAVVWMFVITRGTMLSHIDDSTHWYRICNAMDCEGAYPSTPDIRFYTYVPGTATWIYFVTRFIGFSIPNCLFAQNALNVLCLTAFFCLPGQSESRAYKAAVSVLIILLGIVLGAMDVSTYVLLVDTTLGLVALSALVLLLNQGDKDEAFIPLCMVFSFLAIIKNSALLLILLTVFLGMRERRISRKHLGAEFVGWIAIPLLVFLLYSIRATLVYGQTAGASQSLSISRMTQLFLEKNPERILEIVKSFIGRTVMGEGVLGAVYLVLLLMGMLMVSSRDFCDREKSRHILHNMGSLLGVFLIYALGLLGTYLFSMDLEEAEQLACFQRYYGTIVIYLVGYAIYEAMTLVNGLKIGRAFGISLALAFVMMLPTEKPLTYVFGQEYDRPQQLFLDGMWRRAEFCLPRNRAYSEDRYLVLWNDEEFFGYSNNSNRMKWISGVWLRSNDISAYSIKELRKLSVDELATLGEYDYVAFMSDMNAEKDLLETYLDVDDFGIGFWTL